MKSIGKLWVLLLVLLLSLPATAAGATIFCREVGDRSLCITSIQRSAKNYWEYRAAVRINGIERPIELYNCRDRIRVQSDGASVPFEPDGAGNFVCRLYKK
jgi:hypothetical protein